MGKMAVRLSDAAALRGCVLVRGNTLGTAKALMRTVRSRQRRELR